MPYINKAMKEPEMLEKNKLTKRINVTTTGSVYEEIRRRILNLELPPGTRLKDTELAKDFGISNTPVREALRRLEADSLVETKPYIGTYVKELSTDEVKDLYEVRETLEIMAVRKAVERASEEELNEILEIAKKHLSFVNVGTVEKYLEYDRMFHEKIAAASGNTILYELVHSLGDRIHIVRRIDLEDHMSGIEHLDIANAILKHDAEQATKIIRTHIQSHLSRVEKLLEENSRSPKE
jgi:DNA-binding GntR family transcriptional regulator